MVFLHSYHLHFYVAAIKEGGLGEVFCSSISLLRGQVLVPDSGHLGLGFRQERFPEYKVVRPAQR